VPTVHPQELLAAYQHGRNLMALLRETGEDATNDEAIIEMSYDLQAGSYVSFAETESGRAAKDAVASSFADVLSDLGRINSLLEAGVGETTSLWHLVRRMNPVPQHVHGFDLCWSRISTGLAWWKRQTPRFPATFVTASLAEIPYADDSFDVVFTSHAIEPNRGREEQILKELYRVAVRYLVLLEPAYELASAEARARMDLHRYCRDLPGSARKLGMAVIRHELFHPSVVPLNPTALTIIAKDPTATGTEPTFVCPAYQTPLLPLDGCYFSKESLLAYPVLKGVPCLRTSNSIIASKLLQAELDTL